MLDCFYLTFLVLVLLDIVCYTFIDMEETLTKQKEMKILGDGYIIWCAYCKAVKGAPGDCGYCSKTVTLPQVEIKYGN